MNYSTILRVVGQKLEPLRPETYEVVCYGNCYLVRCRVKEDSQDKKAEEKKVRGLAAFLRAMEGARKSEYWRKAEREYFHECGVLVFRGRAEPRG